LKSSECGVPAETYSLDQIVCCRPGKGGAPKAMLVSRLSAAFALLLCSLIARSHGLEENSTALPLCSDRAIFQYPCKSNDTYCGDWSIPERAFIPNNCRYREVTNEQARKCVGNRTLAFIGDSIIRDIGVGVALFLAGERVEEGLDIKFDKKADVDTYFTNATKIGPIASWKINKDNYNGLLFPKVSDAHPDWQWQVQVWELHSNHYLHQGNVHSVLSNKMPHYNKLLHNIDFAFWQHGLHDYGWWDSPPYGQRYFDTIVKQWVEMRSQVPVPVVWVSMNHHCVKMNPHPVGADIPGAFKKQSDMVIAGNFVTAQKLRQMGLPYWDANRPLRSPDNCMVQGDGVHVKMWVDLVRAKMLFNHLCDEDFNWVGDISRF